MSKSISKLGVTVSDNIRPVPQISYTAPSCTESVPSGYYDDMCGAGSYSGYVIDSVCSCARTDVHTFTVTNTTIDSWSIDYLGGKMKPKIISQNSTTLILDLSETPSTISTPVYCSSSATDSVFEITAFHDYSYKTIKVLAIQC